MNTTRRRRLPAAPTLSAALALVLSLGLTLVATGPPAADAATAAPRCGSSSTLRTTTRTWVCAFDDEFGGSSVDTSRWAVQTTPGSGWTTSDTCYINNGTTISQSGGALHLIARQLDSPMSCGGKYDTVHTGGAVVSYGRFAQTYGRFEIRARFPATTAAGFWGNLWLYPRTLSYGAWPASGEVDMAEHWSGHGDAVVSSLHYSGSTSADARSCNVADAGQFHTYVTEWTSSVFRFYRDGVLCFARDWTAVTGSSKPFDKPFFLMLSEGYGDYALPFASTLPRTGPVDVDYVRVYK